MKTPSRLSALIVLGLLPALAAAGPALERIRTSGKMTIAHRDASVPFSYLDANGKPVGYAVDLCLKLGEAVRKHLALKTLATGFLPVTPATRLTAIKDGQADLECGSTTNNAERRQQVAFTVPHYITGTRYLVRADSAIEELAAFAGKRLVSTKGTTPLKAVTAQNVERSLGITVLEAPDHARAIEMVEKGEADGFAMDDVLLYGLAATRANPKAFKVVGKFLTIEPLAIMLPRDDTELKKIVDDEMKRLIASREAHAIYDKWFAKPIPPHQQALNLPMNYLLRDFWKYPTDQVP
jgi:ABC-type amino acid transport substrate-binding protein